MSNHPVEGPLAYRLMIYSIVGLCYLAVVALGIFIITGLLRVAF